LVAVLILSAVYTDSCPDNHDFARLSATGVGENIAWGLDQVGSVDAWYAEVKNYNLASNTCHAGAVCGHYTQLMWKGTTNVGCGWKPSCVYENDATYTPGELICKYWPAGNVNGLRPYGPNGGVVYKNLGSYNGAGAGAGASLGAQRAQTAARRCHHLRVKLHRCRNNRCRHFLRRAMHRIRHCR
jgi:hypothetical protein